MKPFNTKTNGISYDAIFAALVSNLPAEQRVVDNGELRAGGSVTRSLRNRAKFIAEKALEMPSEDRDDFVNRKIWCS